jgi:hypothetical protein
MAWTRARLQRMTTRLIRSKRSLEERGLEPDEWDITHLKVNEWDGPYGEPLKQLTVNVRRKLTKTFPTACVYS